MKVVTENYFSDRRIATRHKTDRATLGTARRYIATQLKQPMVKRAVAVIDGGKKGIRTPAFGLIGQERKDAKKPGTIVAQFESRIDGKNVSVVDCTQVSLTSYLDTDYAGIYNRRLFVVK